MIVLLLFDPESVTIMCTYWTLMWIWIDSFMSSELCLAGFLHLLLVYYSDNKKNSFVGLLKNILVYTCIFCKQYCLIMVCPNTLSMLYNTLEETRANVKECYLIQAYLYQK